MPNANHFNPRQKSPQQVPVQLHPQGPVGGNQRPPPGQGANRAQMDKSNQGRGPSQNQTLQSRIPSSSRLSQHNLIKHPSLNSVRSPSRGMPAPDDM